MSEGLTYLDAAELVLKDIKRPMYPKELINEIVKRRLIDSTYDTQLKTLNARISVDIKRKGELSVFKRVKRGRKILYTLRQFSNEAEYHSIPHARKMSRREKVVVFKTDELNEIGSFHGIRKDVEPYEKILLDPNNTFLLNRLKAEGDDRYKQIVSYVIVKYQDFLLRFTRGAITNIGQFLQGEYAIGFGGHVEEKDTEPLFTDDSGYLNSLRRELIQEINLDISKLPNYELQTIGVLNDDSTELGRHHFAFVHLLELLELPTGDKDFYKKGEKSINNLQLIPVSEISKEFGRYEYWSKLCLQTFFSDKLSFECHIHQKPSFSLSKDKDLILIVGYIGSGKTEACTLLWKEFGYTLVPCSRILQKEMKSEPIEKIGREKMQELGLQFINSPDGHERLARAISTFMEKNPSPTYVLDGLRYPKTLESLENILEKKVNVIYVESTIDSMYEFYLKRERKLNHEKEFKEFLKEVYHPVEREIERFWPLSNITIYNHGSKEAYLQRLREFFREELTRDHPMGQ